MCYTVHGKLMCYNSAHTADINANNRQAIASQQFQKLCSCYLELKKTYGLELKKTYVLNP